MTLNRSFTSFGMLSLCVTMALLDALAHPQPLSPSIIGMACLIIALAVSTFFIKKRKKYWLRVAH
jgi:hypothetical protein